MLHLAQKGQKNRHRQSIYYNSPSTQETRLVTPDKDNNFSTSYSGRQPKDLKSVFASTTVQTEPTPTWTTTTTTTTPTERDLPKEATADDLSALIPTTESRSYEQPSIAESYVLQLHAENMMLPTTMSNQSPYNNKITWPENNDNHDEDADHDPDNYDNIDRQQMHDHVAKLCHESIETTMTKWIQWKQLPQMPASIPDHLKAEIMTRVQFPRPSARTTKGKLGRSPTMPFTDGIPDRA